MLNITRIVLGNDGSERHDQKELHELSRLNRTDNGELIPTVCPFDFSDDWCVSKNDKTDQ